MTKGRKGRVGPRTSTPASPRSGGPGGDGTPISPHSSATPPPPRPPGPRRTPWRLPSELLLNLLFAGYGMAAEVSWELRGLLFLTCCVLTADLSRRINSPTLTRWGIFAVICIFLSATILPKTYQEFLGSDKAALPTTAPVVAISPKAPSTENAGTIDNYGPIYNSDNPPETDKSSSNSSSDCSKSGATQQFDHITLENGGGNGMVIYGSPSLCISNLTEKNVAGDQILEIPAQPTNSPAALPAPSKQQ